MKSKTNETQPAPPTEVVVAATADTNRSGTSALAVPEDMQQMFADAAGAGLEDFSSDDFAIPFITILQKNSPQVDEADGAYIQYAKPGMVLESVSSKLFDCACLPGRQEPEGLGVIVAAMKRWMVEWRPRPAKGFAGLHEVDSPVHKSAVPHKEKKSLLSLPNGNDLADTMYFYLILDLPDGPGWAVVAMDSTDLTEAKKWSTRIVSQKFDTGNGVMKSAPMYGQSYRLFAKVKENDFGSWMGWRVAAEGLVKDRALFEAGQAYRKAILTGKAKTTAPPAGGADPNADGGAAAGGKDKDVPF